MFTLENMCPLSNHANETATDACMSSMYFYLFLLLCNRVSHADDISLFYFILSTIFQASFVDMDEDFLGPENFDGQQAFNLLKVRAIANICPILLLLN